MDHRSNLKGIVYLNLTFKRSNDSRNYTLEYEPVLISSEVTTCIYGAQTEEKFKSCHRDFEKSTICYVTKDNQTVDISCYKEKVSATTAFVKVAEIAAIHDKFEVNQSSVGITSVNRALNIDVDEPTDVTTQVFSRDILDTTHIDGMVNLDGHVFSGWSHSLKKGKRFIGTKENTGHIY